MGIIQDNFLCNRDTIGGAPLYYTNQPLTTIMPFGDQDSFNDFITKYPYTKVPRQLKGVNMANNAVILLKEGTSTTPRGTYYYLSARDTPFDNYYLLPVYRSYAYGTTNFTSSTNIQGTGQTIINTENPYSSPERAYNNSGLGNLPDLDYTKLVLYPKIVTLNLETLDKSTLNVNEYKNASSPRIPLYLVFDVYYGNDGTRERTDSLSFVYMAKNLVSEEWNIPRTQLGLTCESNSFIFPFVSSSYGTRSIPLHAPLVAIKTTALPTGVASGYFMANTNTTNSLITTAPYTFSGSDITRANDGWNVTYGRNFATYSQLRSLTPIFSNYLEGSSDADRDGWDYLGMPIAYMGIDSILTLINSFGCYWAETLSAVQSPTGINADDNDLHLPIIDENGVNGNSVIGKGIRQVPLGNEKDMSNKTPSKYVDQKNVDPNKYTDRVPLTVPALSPIGAFNTAYGISLNDVNRFCDWLWNTDQTQFDDIVENLKMFSNPIDAVISLRLYPFDVTRVKAGVGTNKEIVLGRIGSGVMGVELLPNWYAMINMGTCTYYEQFKNFMDYDYVNASLYLPYIGIVNIDPTMFMGKTIDIRYIIDIMTGKCTAVVYANQVPILYQDGTIGVDVPISAQDKYNYYTQMQNNKMEQKANSFNTAMGLMGSATAFGVSLASGNIAGAVASGESFVNNIASGIVNQKQLEKRSQMTTVDIVKLTASTPSCSNWQPQTPYFILQRPIPEYPSNYGRVYGYLYNKAEKLSDLSGFTVIDNPQLEGINAPSEVLTKISDLMNGGILI